MRNLTKKLILIIGLVFSISSFISCTSSESEQKHNEKKVIKFLTEFYNDYVLNGQPDRNTGTLREHYTPHMLKKMKDAVIDENSCNRINFNIFDLGIPIKMGGSEVFTVTPLGYDWYEIMFIDNGYIGYKRICAFFADDKIMIDDVENRLDLSAEYDEYY